MDVISGKVQIKSEYDSSRFFTAALTFGDDLDLLYNLTDPAKAGETCLKSAFRFGCYEDINIQTFNNNAMKFLAFLGKDELSKGSSKACSEQCYGIIYKIPGVLNTLKKFLEQGNIDDPTVLAWFIVSVTRSDAEARHHQTVNEIAEILAKHDSRAVQELITIMFPNKAQQSAAASGQGMGKVQSLEDLQAFEPQHDNDFPFDYRSIKILPTAGEINSFATSAFGMQTTLSSLVEEGDIGEGKVATILDRQFRLLRADMIMPLKEELGSELKLPVEQRRRFFASPRMLDVCMTEGSASVLVSVEMPPALRGRVAKMKPKERMQFFEEGGRRVLGKDSMLVFLADSGVTGKDRALVPKFMGLVTRRDQKEFARQEGCLCVGVTFQPEDLVTLLAFLEDANSDSRQPRHPSQACVAKCVFQASSSYFSYEPVLSCLQAMSDIPFDQELVFGQPPALLEHSTDDVATVNSLSPMYDDNSYDGYSSDGYFINNHSADNNFSDDASIPSAIRDKLAQDPSQLAAAEYAIQHRLALIQGIVVVIVSIIVIYTILFNIFSCCYLL